MKTVAIQDASILIDCANLDIFAHVLSLPYRFQTTDLIFLEIEYGAAAAAVAKCSEKGLLSVISFTTEELTNIDERSQIHRSLSLEDCSVWYLAETAQGILLIGDKVLRKKASQSGIEVHGTLWLLMELERTGQISPAEACQKLHSLREQNPRLPQNIVTQLLEQWCG